ncbi:MAG: 3-phosphoshikimate 1-carboxyvinyltransferase [Candidatus Omnitrophota bacterium]|nr:MAG: 3-phosphoshikimate 1-carboxyvinyltransferase [Candidatus Omnitrophota bacterium]
MYTVRPLRGLKREIHIPPDKSISHRAAMISSLCNGHTLIKPFLRSDDTLATLSCIERLGIKVQLTHDNSLTVWGKGLYLPQNKQVILQAYESGTTMRILSGLLVAQRFSSRFEAGPFLADRPMGRIVLPLREMGARICGVQRPDKNGREETYPPLEVDPTDQIKGKDFRLPIASAQVKSALMLASLYAQGKTAIAEPYQSRNHTEQMFKQFGANVQIDGTTVTCTSVKELISPRELFIPSDFSSAAFFITLGLILKDSKFTMKNVNINPTRCGLLSVLERMGANIRIENKRGEYEPCADIIVESSQLKPVNVEPGLIPLMIDEVPLLCVAAAFASGVTQIRGVKELRVKETDRVSSIVSNLTKAGVDIHSEQDGDDEKIVIEGGRRYVPAEFMSHGDHRTAMSMVIFAAALEKESVLDNEVCINKSFPEFISLMTLLAQ